MKVVDARKPPPAPPPRDERCALHRAHGTARQKPSGGYVISCPTCKEVQAAEIADRPIEPEWQREIDDKRRARGGEAVPAEQMVGAVLASAAAKGVT